MGTTLTCEDCGRELRASVDADADLCARCAIARRPWDTYGQADECEFCGAAVVAERPVFAGSPDPLWRDPEGSASCSGGGWHSPGLS